MQRSPERIFDEYLVAAARAGDRASWERLVARWQPRLLRHAWRLTGDSEGARDRVQEAWLEIVRGLARLDDVVAFPAWAFRIVTRRCQRGGRQAERERREAEALACDAEPASDEQASAEFAFDLDQALLAIQALPPAQRAAIALFHLDQLSVAEIAVALDVPPGTVKTRLMHARRRIRAHLEGTLHEQD